MSFVPKLKEFVKTKLWYIVGVVSCVSLGIGGFIGWNHYQHLQSPQYFLEQLNIATKTNDFTKLATLVDFRSLMDDIAMRIVRAPIPPSPDKPREIDYIALSEQVQKDLIERMLTKDKNIAEGPLNPDLLAPTEPLPKDFAAQMSGNFKLQALLEDQGIVSVSINYPSYKRSFNFLFSLEKKPDWILTRLNNIDELISNYLTEENKLEVLRDLKFQKDNAARQAQMNEQFKVEKCTAFAHTASGGQSTLFVRINGFNSGSHIIRNMTFETEVIAHTDHGNISIKRDLNMAARLMPSINLADSYTIDLDPDNPEDMKILNAQSFSCTAKPRMMTLGNGKLLFTKRHRFAQ